MPEESLDGWLAHHAAMMGCSLVDLARTLGFDLGRAPQAIIRHLTATQRASIADQMGETYEAVTGATLSRWSTLGFCPKGTAGIDMRCRHAGVRFCWGCLSGTPPVDQVISDQAAPEAPASRPGWHPGVRPHWRLDWNLLWTNVCLDHHTFLETVCPRCGRTPTHAGGRRTQTHQRGVLAVCTNGCSPFVAPPQTDADGRGYIPFDHPVLATQQQINDVIVSHADRPGTRDPRAWDTHPPSDPAEVTVGGVPVPPEAWFSDLAFLRGRITFVMSRYGIEPTMRRLADQGEFEHFFDMVGNCEPLPEPHPKRGSVLMAEPRLEAVVTTFALDMVNSDHMADLRYRWSALAFDGPIYQSQIGISHVLTELVRGDRQRRSTARALVSDKARTRRPFVRVNLPDQVPSRVFSNLVHRHPRLQNNELFAALGAVALVGLNTSGDIDVNACAVALGLGSITSGISAAWQEYLGDEVAALVNGARTGVTPVDDVDGVDQVDDAGSRPLVDDLMDVSWLINRRGSPIDWARRRHTFTEPCDLAARIVGKVAQETGATRTAAFSLTCAFYVYEQLSGADALLSPRGIDLHGAFRMRYRRQRLRWDFGTPTAITEIVEAALLRHKINEPTRWQPEVGVDGWTHPKPDYTRSLAGWETRDLRRSSRYRTPRQLTHAPHDDIVAFVLTQDTPYARRIRGYFLKVVRRPAEFVEGAKSLPQGVRPILHLLTSDLGRDLTTGPLNRLTLTKEGRALIVDLRDRLEPCREARIRISTPRPTG